MKRLGLAVLLALFGLSARATAQCLPSNAPSGSFGCETVASSTVGGYVAMWFPNAFPNSNQIAPIGLFGGGSGGNVNVTQWDTVNLGAPSNYGTSPGAVTVPGVNAFVTNTVSTNLAQINGSNIATAATGSQKVGITGNAGGVFDFTGQNAASPANALLMGCQFNTSPTTITSGNASPCQFDNAGNLKVNVAVGGGTGGTSSTYGATFPTVGTAIGIKNGGNMIALAGDASGRAFADILGSAGGVMDAVGQNATAPANALQVGGQFNTSPTTITSGNFSPFQLDSGGNLKVNVAVGGGTGGTSSTFGATFPATGTAIGVKNGGNMLAIAGDASGRVQSDLFGNTGAAMDFAGQNAASPANALLHGCQFNTSPTTITSGNASPVQCDSAGNVKVNVAAGGTVAQGASISGEGGSLILGASSGNNTVIIQADTSVPITVTTNSTTQLVALSSGKKIYVMALDLIAAGTTGAQFEYGTGTNCGTGTTVLTGNYSLTAQVGLTKGSGLGPVLVVPASNALCIVTTGSSVAVAGSAAYTQF